MSTNYPDEINGVSTKTKAGQWKKRYSPEEQLRMLGATQAELNAFIKLFCPAHPEFSVTRAASGDPRDWVKAKGRLDEARVIRHLLGDRVPGRPPQWVAPWPTKYTRWVALDVDCHGDDLEDYQRRYNRALGAMIKLGFPRQSLLISDTPSGGVHLIGFFSSTMPVVDVATLFNMIGVQDARGQTEVYPHKNHGLRLPFGKLPDRQLDPEAWIEFIRRFQAGEVFTPKWQDVWARARSTFEPGSVTNHRTPSTAISSHQPMYMSVCGSPRADVRRHRTVAERDDTEPPLVRAPRSRAEAKRMIEEGIPGPGTRVTVTKHIAWHLIKVKDCSATEAIRFLNEWVYATGEGVSKDVDEDLRRGTRRVADQNADIVRWTMDAETDAGAARRPRLFPEEIARIVELLDWTKGSFEDEVAFACRALEFAKTCGVGKPEGWEAPMAAKSVFRTWPRCSGKRYKPLLDAVVERGVMRLVRNEKRSTNGTGRARTYCLAVQPVLEERSRQNKEVPLDVDAAVAYALSLVRAASERLNAESDTYWNVPLWGIRRQRERTTNSKRGDGQTGAIAGPRQHPLEELRERQRRPISSRIKYGNEHRTVPRRHVDPDDVQALRDEMRRSVRDSWAHPRNNL
ncbi:hypothetical protein MalM25_08380 [Planctomycetes bacterium MalM25]|nr:hypothetical protein MalM25_08380 [Planctomycetes bacterium MalM25]